MELIKKSKLRDLFADEESMMNFVDSYWNELSGDRRTTEKELFGWDSVADDIYQTLGSENYEIGNYANVEISSHYTKSGNPELINVGEVIAVPQFNEYDDGVGDYIFK